MSDKETYSIHVDAISNWCLDIETERQKINVLYEYFFYMNIEGYKIDTGDGIQDILRSIDDSLGDVHKRICEYTGYEGGMPKRRVDKNGQGVQS